jgi:exoribonuclease R
MEQDKYLHVTSPIRRMTDIINQTIYHQEQGLSMSIYSYDFVNKWLTVIHKLNDQVKKIKKVQNQMNILYAIEHNKVDISKSYVSCIFQKECVDDGYMYQVFIKELSLFQQVYSTNSLDMYSDVEVKIFYMNDEFQTYKKIRCTMV